MKVVVHPEAARNYSRRTSRRFGPAYVPPNFRSWLNTLSAVQGMTLEVDTEYLFSDQYNTVPIPGISENGLRLMDEDITEVIDDARTGKGKCNWCGSTVDDLENPCHDKKYLTVFKPFKPKVRI